MSLVPLTMQRDIDAAYATMCGTLNQDCQVIRRKVGWRGGSGDYDLQWNSGLGFWTMQEQFDASNRHILLLGTQDPEPVQMVSIICEANAPRNGVNRRCAGVFLKDQTSNVYLAHSGKIGGGRAGIGKSAMLQNYSGSWQTVNWGDGKSSEMIVIGKIESPRLPTQLALFAREVQRIKAQAAANSSRSSNQVVPPTFNPEFSGRRRRYSITSPIEADCDHGLIVNSLAEELRHRNLQFSRNVNCDLFIYGNQNYVKMLFEAKTAVETSTIYQGIGQLLYHSATLDPRPALVFVIPGRADHLTKSVLDQLGIKILSFEWDENRPVFSNLDEVLNMSS